MDFQKWFLLVFEMDKMLIDCGWAGSDRISWECVRAILEQRWDFTYRVKMLKRFHKGGFYACLYDSYMNTTETTSRGHPFMMVLQPFTAYGRQARRWVKCKLVVSIIIVSLMATVARVFVFNGGFHRDSSVDRTIASRVDVEVVPTIGLESRGFFR